MTVPPTAIEQLRARQILDSRGTPTVEVDVVLVSGALGRAAVPSGASTGAHEAHELRDDGAQYAGKAVTRAVASVHDLIAPETVGRDALDQRGLDEALILVDGTQNLSRLGANAVLGVSLAAAKAAASHLGIPLYRYLGGPTAGTLPVPFLNVINGGAHADNGIDIQEFMIAPVGASSFAEALRAGAEVYASLRTIARHRGLDTNVGDEGGIAPELDSAEAALDLLVEAVTAAGYEPGRDIVLALDVAATELCNDGRYRMQDADLDAGGMVELLARLVDAYPIVSIEDGCAEDDWTGWQKLTEAVGNRTQIVGDDLLVTNPARLATAIARRCGNAILIKPNQIGTLTATLDTIAAASKAGWSAMISHRSGETEDTTIAHIAAGTGAGQIKSGAPARGERTAKYNELLRIEESLGAGARYAGWRAFPRAVGQR